MSCSSRLCASRGSESGRSAANPTTISWRPRSGPRRPECRCAAGIRPSWRTVRGCRCAASRRTPRADRISARCSPPARTATKSIAPTGAAENTRPGSTDRCAVRRQGCRYGRASRRSRDAAQPLADRSRGSGSGRARWSSAPPTAQTDASPPQSGPCRGALAFGCGTTELAHILATRRQLRRRS